MTHHHHNHHHHKKLLFGPVVEIITTDKNLDNLQVLCPSVVGVVIQTFQGCMQGHHLINDDPVIQYDDPYVHKDAIMKQKIMDL